MEKTSSNQVENEIYKWNEEDEINKGNLIKPNKIEI
jgi:hypothetical protein